MTVDTSRLQILHYPDAILREKARPIDTIDDEVRDVAARMIKLMHEAEGVGLAAPQVGLSWRLFVTAGRAEGEPDRVFINPHITIDSREAVAHEEGCLSLPGIHVEVRRPGAVSITATDLEGNEFTLRDAEFLARVWQHEADHLDGVLIIDRMSPMDRLATRKALRELEAGVAPHLVGSVQTRRSGR